MFINEKKRGVFILIIVSLFAGVLSLVRVVTPSYAEELSNIYLPLVENNFPPPPTVFGVEVHSFTDPDIVQLAIDARVSWVRIPAFDWSIIEPNAPVGSVHSYDWDQVPESSLLNISSNHMYPIATVKMTPYWAQKYKGTYCGPIAEENFVDFALFMQVAVSEYSKPPYNIHYWELGNEPDVARDFVPADYPFGCWGETDDPFYGGRYYAEMLKVVYPAIKAADPSAQVLIGGLLLDCDPNDTDCSDPAPSKFFNGILENEGDKYFDIISFHSYPGYHSPDYPFYNDIYHKKWNLRGGILMGKIDYINEVMADYGINKPIILSEGGLMCVETNPYCQPTAGADFLDAQASYILWYYVRSLANGFETAIWYTFEGSGWRSVGMVGDDPANPRPAYQVFKFATKELSEVEFSGYVNTGNPLHGYAFSKPGKTIWVLWSPDGNEYDFTVPSSYNQVLDRFGNLVVPQNEIIKVNSPVYIELP